MLDPTSNTISPPRKLGAHGSSLWNVIMSEYHLEDAGGLELLAQACQALDRAESLAERIAADGEVIPGRNGPRSHPALRDKLANRQAWRKRKKRSPTDIRDVYAEAKANGFDVKALRTIVRPAQAGCQ